MTIRQLIILLLIETESFEYSSERDYDLRVLQGKKLIYRDGADVWYTTETAKRNIAAILELI